MGLFSSKKKIYVSSVVYNLAGDEDDRPQYLKTAVVGHVMSGSKASISDSISRALLTGPGIKLRSFARWGRTSGYNVNVGQTAGLVSSGNSVDYSTLAAYIPHNGGESVSIQSVNIGNADYTYWVDQYMLIHHPGLINSNFVSEFRTGIGIRITLEGGAIEDFFPENWDPQGRWMYVAYNTDGPGGNNLQMYIYKYGMGNGALDAMFAPAYNVGQFFPFIPVRVNNRWVSESHPATYQWAKKAYRKAFNKGNFDDLIKQVGDNPSIGDIDYAFVTFGVSLNSKEYSAQKYVYQFFKTIRDQGTYDGSYGSWQAQWDAASAQMDIWTTWKVAQDTPSNPLYGTPEPPNPTFPRLPNNMTQVMSTPVLGMNYNMTIKWASLTEQTGGGLIRPGTKAGDIWWDTGPGDSYQETIYSDGPIPLDSFVL